MSMSSSVVDSSSTVPLRKRMNILGKAQSLSSLNSFTTDQDTGHERDKSLSDKSQADYESVSESSEGSDMEHAFEAPAPKSKNAQRRPRIDTNSSIHGTQGSWKSKLPSYPSPSGPESPTTKAWYEFDLAVVVALVSPIGNWLTGGDHIKNLFLIVLLIFYLHQIIEIPWTLYNAARTRRRAPYVKPITAADHQRRLAETELRNLELFFLFLTAISPFLGAILLRYATSSIIGMHAVSWFSTGLFVLATGMRPWSHLIERLRDRTKALHDAIHYPPERDDSTRESVAMRQEMEELRSRMEKMESRMGKMRDRMRMSTEDVFDYVDEAVIEVEKSVKRLEKRGERDEGRWKEVAETVGALKGKKKQPVPVLWIPPKQRGIIKSFMEYIFPAWLVAPAERNIYNREVAYTTGATPTPTSPFSHHHHHHHRKHSSSPPTSPSATYHSPPSMSGDWSTLTTGGLETIVEEDGSGAVNVKTVLRTQKSSGSAMTLIVQAIGMPLYDFASRIFWWAGYVATIPLRAIARLVLRAY